MSTLSEESGAMGSVEDAASKAELQPSLNLRSRSCPPDFLYRMRAFNKPSSGKWDATFLVHLVLSLTEQVAVKQLGIAVNTAYTLVIVMDQLQFSHIVSMFTTFAFCIVK